MEIKLDLKEDGSVEGKFSPQLDTPLMNIGPKDASYVLEKLDKINHSKTGLLAPAIRWISASKRLVMFERPPTKKVISWIPLDRDSIDDESYNSKFPVFEIEIPWQVYLAYFDQNYTPVIVKMFFRNSMIGSMQDPLYIAPILNFYYNSKLCNPIFEKYEAHESNLSTGINAVYNAIWNSGFNYDLKDAVSVSIMNKSPVSVGNTRTERNLLAKSINPNYIDNFCLYYNSWSKLTRREVLDKEWVYPYYDTSGKIAGNIESSTVENIINMTKKEVSQTDTGINPENEFIVNLVNIMSS